MAKWDGWGGGGGGGVFRRDVITVMVKARGSELGNVCSFIRTLPYSDRKDRLLKERLDCIDVSRKTNHVDQRHIVST